VRLLIFYRGLSLHGSSFVPCLPACIDHSLAMPLTTTTPVPVPPLNIQQIAFLGDKAVGKSSLIRALRPHVPSHFRVVSGLEGENAAAHEQRVRSHMVIVWTSQLPETMKVYTARYRATMPSTTSTIAVSNMTDVAPCPLPEMNAMRGTRVPALAVSAARGTNVGALWILIERSMRAVPGAPLGTPLAAPSLELQQTRTPRPGLAETYRAASPPPTRQSRRDEMPSPLSIIPSAGEASSLGGEGGSPSRGDTANFVRPATSFVKREEEERGSADALKHVHGRDREASPLARREQVRSRVVMAA
jgi:hypothetical protein